MSSRPSIEYDSASAPPKITARSSAAICWEIADWVNDRASAAAEKEPRTATSRRTRIRRTSSIRWTYSSPTKCSFVLMEASPHHGAHEPPPSPVTGAAMSLQNVHPTVAIRAARGSDGLALSRLAELDSKRPLTGEVLVAERDGELAAAVSLTTGAHVADPFRPTAELVALLRLHAAAFEPAGEGDGRRWG